ncbi:hypothetical protein J1N35_023282 [Gossypium stocksii]|uniref:Uncharacterized protein n=1 Tax=Gossypium stocksii TaxID=47602 RepID=A0A9D3VIQ8_9ROSI|nr:hypothetical protein J1N35_023282 [Gossypium stocksii]
MVNFFSNFCSINNDNIISSSFSTGTLTLDKVVLKPDGEIEGAKTRTNPTFEGPVGEDVQLTLGILDSGGGLSSSKYKKLMGNFNASRGSRKMNNVLKRRGSRFKSSGNSRVLLTESMEAVVDLLSSHVAGGTGKEAQVVALLNLDGVLLSSNKVLIDRSEKISRRI